MKCRTLSEAGLKGFRSFIEQLSSERKLDTPRYLLTEANTSEEMPFDVELSDEVFESRFALGAYLVSVFESYEMQNFLEDEGFWSWLALYWFDHLCPPDGNGNRAPAKYYNYILTPNFKHRARHAIRTSYMLVRKYGEDSRFLLCNPLHIRGDLTEQLTTRQFLIECEGVIRSAATLYFDSTTGMFKRGATSSKRKGNVRRFVAYLQQIGLTYDLYSIGAEDLTRMLPNEFEGFLGTE